MRPFIRFALLLMMLILTACAPQRGDDMAPWRADDLRALDAADPIPPEGDLTALYLRRIGQDFQIRLDLLDFSAGQQSDLLITLWDNAAFASDPLQILIPADKPAQVLERTTCTARIIPRVQRDPIRDTVTLTLRAAYLGSQIQVEALSLDVDASQPRDTIRGRLSGIPPRAHASLYLAFYHVLPADTPAQALRSWDGAHAGPHGTRHGLSHLLEAAQNHRIPLILLDARDPRSLAALDLLGQLPRLQEAQISGTLLLPNVAYLEAPPRGWEDAAFGLRPSPFAYAPYLHESRSQWRFVPLADTRHLYHAAGITYLPLPDEKPDYRLNEDGLPLILRRALLALALDGKQDDMLALGGNLQTSDWGTAGYAEAALAWIAARPYLHLLSPNDLQTFPTRPRPPLLAQRYWQPSLPAANSPLPAEAALRSAIGATLNAPRTRLEMENLALHSNILQIAAQWQQGITPPLTSGTLAILADSRYLAFVDTQNGGLLYLFARPDGKLHQIIAPSSQAAIGLSDPDEWQPNGGWMRDPQTVISLNDQQPYSIAVQAAEFLKIENAAAQKTFILDEGGLHIRVCCQNGIPQTLSFLLDPWERFQGGWASQRRLMRLSDGWLLRGEKVQVRVRARGALEAFSWQDSLSTLRYPENPDYNYPRGHYLPIPLTKLIWHPENSPAQIDLSVLP